MTNAELIKALRTCADHNAVGDKCYGECPYNGDYNECVDQMILDASDALEAADEQIEDLQKQVDEFIKNETHSTVIKVMSRRIAELEDDLRNGTISDPEYFKIYNYSLKDLIMFAEMCKRNNVRDADLKQAAWNIEFAVRAVMSERQEITKNMLDEITMMFTPNFEEAYKEMMENCILPHVKGEKNEQENQEEKV